MRQLKHILGVLALGLVINFFGLNAYAAPSVDEDNGTYSDSFSDGTGLSTTSGAGVNSGVVQLKNAGGTYTSPYLSWGYVETKVIMPRSVAKWGTISFTANTPANTSIRVQVLDSSGHAYTDSDLPGNLTGFTSSPIDISSLSILKTADTPGNNDAKKLRIKIRVVLATTDTNVTPTFDNLNFTWTVKQGDFTASPFSTSSPWPWPAITQNATSHSSYSNKDIYPAFKWATEKQVGYYESVFSLIYGNQFIGSATNIYQAKDKLYSINRDTGSITWDEPYLHSLDGTIAQNGTFYTADIWYDVFMATDLNDGSTKWSYQFNSGHGNSQASLDDNGISYTTRTGADDYVSVYAFNPDGSILWTQTIDPPNNITNTPLTISPDGTIYFGTNTWDSEGNSLGQGKLYALEPEHGTILWSYDTGDLIVQPVIDNDGTIYVASQGYSALPINVFAIIPGEEPDLKWQQTITPCEIDCSYISGYYELSLRSDGILLGLRFDQTNQDGNFYQKLDAIDTTDGSIEWTQPTYAQNPIMTDKDNNLITVDTLPGATEHDWYTRITQYDPDYNLQWKISYPYNDLDGSYNTSQYFYALAQDERGWLYGSFGQFYADNSFLNLVPGNNFVQFFGLAPWTISSSVSDDTPEPGDIVTFRAESSMSETNPLLGGDNGVQVVLDNKDRVVLDYVSTEGDNSVWEGTYTIPESTAIGLHPYTVEAAQTYLQTDISTRFESAPTGSGNTGITTTGNFTVQAPTPTPTPTPTTEPTPTPTPTPTSQDTSTSGTSTSSSQNQTSSSTNVTNPQQTSSTTINNEHDNQNAINAAPANNDKNWFSGWNIAWTSVLAIIIIAVLLFIFI